MKVAITNHQVQNFAFEATVLTLQGQHVTIRASLPGGVTTEVTLPEGVTLDMLANTSAVAAELSKAAPRYSIAAVSNPNANNLSDFDAYQVVQVGPAANIALTTLGVVRRAGKLTRLRVTAKVGAVAAETLDIDQIKVNGVAVTIPAPLLLTGPTADFEVVEFDLNALLGPILVPDGAYLELAATHAGGPGLSGVVVELIVSR